jgi:hypothetical protein
MGVADMIFSIEVAAADWKEARVLFFQEINIVMSNIVFDG